MSEREFFLAAREVRDPSARAAYLDETCAGDTSLRERIESLLREDNASWSFLDSPYGTRPEPTTYATTDFPFLAPPGRPDSLGRIDSYEILEVLGQGGFGIVFRAFDATLQRVVAVKVLAPALSATSPARKRFLREARSAGAVRHENVVGVHVVAEQPLPYLVMDFIPGETLQERIERAGPLDVAEVVRLGRQIALGLAAAHALGLVHRDIKPANVLIERGPLECVKLVDFGLARAADDASISQSGLIVGTPMYTSPEQAQADPVDHRADLFSLGSLLYFMICGHPPFRASGALAVLKRVIEDTPRPIPEIIPEAPSWMCDLIGRLHAKNAADRLQSAQEVADLLGSHLTAGDQPMVRQDIQLCLDKAVVPPPTVPHSLNARPAVRRRRYFFRRLAAAAMLLLCASLVLAEATGLTRLRESIALLYSGEKNRSLADSTTTGGETRNGNEVGGANPPIPTGNFALEFDGTTSYVDIPTLSRDEDKPITIEGYITVNGTQGAVLVRVEGTCPCQMYGWPTRRITSGWVPNGADHQGTKMNAELTPPLLPGRRVHVAFQMDEQSSRFFIDGQEVNFTTRSPTPGSGKLRGTLLGAQRRGQIRNIFSGKIEEVRISRTLRYNGDFTPARRFTPDMDTIALYHCDEGTGDKLTDSSGNGHHGKIVGAKWVKGD